MHLRASAAPDLLALSLAQGNLLAVLVVHAQLPRASPGLGDCTGRAWAIGPSARRTKGWSAFACAFPPCCPNDRGCAVRPALAQASDRWIESSRRLHNPAPEPPYPRRQCSDSKRGDMMS